MSIHSEIQLFGRTKAHGDFGVDGVYVVDDHSEVRRSLDILLSTFGISTRVFASAREFLDRLPSLAPAPVLLDITMPGMSGIELLETLAARKMKWPVLIMTGLSEVPVAYRALELGAMGVLEKPFSAEILESSVRAALAAMSALVTPLPGGRSNVSR